MSKPFNIDKHTTIDKEFAIEGPEGVMLYVDYDDVDHGTVDTVINRMVELLNNSWAKTAPVVVPDTLPRNSCNRHNDCKAADEKARARGAMFGASHCHDEECEDCFGC